MVDHVRQPRFRRISNVLVSALLSAAIIWLAITRWNSVPANPATPSLVDSLPSPPIDPQLDRTDELATALSAIPPIPPQVLPPPPPGMRWNHTSSSGLDISDALCGEWSLDTRPNLQGVVQFLQTPAVEQALSRLAPIEVGVLRADSVNLSSLRQAARLLAARARLRLAGHGDFDGAWTDLVTLLRLSSSGYNSGGSLLFLVSLACESLAEWELIRLCHENAITIPQLKRIASDLSKNTLNQQEIWNCFVAGRCDARQRILDFAYTDDRQGDGWLVLSHMDDLLRPAWARERRCGGWNLLSPLFNGRRTVADKLKAYRNACGLIGELPYAEAQSAAARADSRASFFSILDGPLAMLAADQFVGYGHVMTVRQTATQRACLACAALSAYRHDHGEYPASLDALVGDYLESPPIDPYCDQPLRYQQKEGGRDFLLYALGPNQKDDGGVKKATNSRDPPSLRKEDVVFDHIRPKPNFEPTLEPKKK